MFSLLNDSIRYQRLVPFQLNRAGGHGDRARRRLVGRGRSQGVELTHWTLAAALSNVQNRDFKELYYF